MEAYLDTLWLHLSSAPSGSALRLTAAWKTLMDGEIRRNVHNLHQILELHPKQYLPIRETSLFLTDDGMFGFAPNHIMPGDIVSRHPSREKTSRHILPIEVRILRPVTSDTLKIMAVVKVEGEQPDWKSDVPSWIKTKLHGLLILVLK